MQNTKNIKILLAVTFHTGCPIDFHLCQLFETGEGVKWETKESWEKQNILTSSDPVHSCDGITITYIDGKAQLSTTENNLRYLILPSDSEGK